MDGIGFPTADAIAIQMGIPRDSDYRIQSALRFSLREAAGSFGHVFLPKAELVHKTAILLRLEDDLVARQLVQLTIRQEVVLWQYEDEADARVYLPKYDRAEKEVAQRLCELSAAIAPRSRPQTER